MDRRLNSEIISPMYGFYSFSAEDGFIITEDCSDLAGLIGRTVEEIKGQQLSSLISCSDREETAAKLKEQLDHMGETEALINFTGKDGTCFCVLNRGKIQKDPFGNEYVRNVFVLAEETGKLVAQLKNIAEAYRIKLLQNEKRMDLLQTYAWQDSLTGILNAGTTRKLSEEYISEKESYCAMLIIDLDDFKRINDRYGHMVGDKVLICIANAIKKLFRSNDIVGRVGGDEFLVLMKDVSNKDLVSVRCSQVTAAINDIQFEGIKDERMSCSVGAVIAGAADLSYDDMFMNADNAMYQAKRSGGNRYIVKE